MLQEINQLSKVAQISHLICTIMEVKEMKGNDYVTCTYCGIVERGHICPYKPKRKKEEITKERKFRNTKAWAKKSKEIRERDKYLCQVCLSGKYNTFNVLNYDKIEVHHIVPLSVDYNKRLDNGNLITLCKFHHIMAEKGEISQEELKKLIPPV